NFRNIKSMKKLKPGMRVYAVNREKNIALAVIGKKPVENGLNIVVSHIDSPRLDLKPNPLYEDKDAGVALFKTHYYGGIRKYHWVNTPLALHGKIIKRNGEAVNIKIGENSDEPVFIIPDLLPHLSKNLQDKRKLPEGIKGEELNILVGSMPVKDKNVKEKIKIAVLENLNKKYGITEEDFVSAELEAVPATTPREIGFDKSMIGAYGQDDRICAYASLMAI
ncbi:MAG: aminopeptidase, partial [Euryarchaeota archaeon CG01_land_8_20_14_3_00_38_12]